MRGSDDFGCLLRVMIKSIRGQNVNQFDEYATWLKSKAEGERVSVEEVRNLKLIRNMDTFLQQYENLSEELQKEVDKC